MNNHEHTVRRAVLADFLASVEILSAFTPDELERLAADAQSRFYAFGDTVCSAGEPADGLFVVKSGSVRVFTEENGKEISMGVRKAGEVFAEIAMLRDAPARIVGAGLGQDRTAGSSRARPSHRSSPATRPRATSSPAMSRSVRPAAWSPGCSTCAARSASRELEELVRSVGVKRVGAGKEILKQDAREDRRLYVVRQRRGAGWCAARTAPNTRWPRCGQGETLRREGLPAAPGADGVGHRGDATRRCW